MDWIMIDSAVSVTLSPASMPAMVRGTAFSQTVTASGGTAPYAYTVIAGALPTGLALNGSTGAITGTPTVAGAYDFTVGATDATAQTGSRRYVGTVNSAVITISPSAMPDMTQGAAVSQVFTASGGSGGYSWTLDSGALPAGLSLNGASGTVFGTPTGSGAYVFVLRATDAYGNSATRPLSGSITADPYPIGYVLNFGTCYESGSVHFGTVTVNGPNATSYLNSEVIEDVNGKFTPRTSVANWAHPDLAATGFQAPGTPSGRKWKCTTFTATLSPIAFTRIA